MPDLKDGKLELLTDKNSVLALIDYQPSMIRSVGSGDKTVIRAAAMGAAKVASILGVPVVLSSINPKNKGEFSQRLPDYFRIRRCLHERSQALMPLKTKERGMRSRK